MIRFLGPESGCHKSRAAITVVANSGKGGLAKTHIFAGPIRAFDVFLQQ
jgi:hypothetical protein